MAFPPAHMLIGAGIAEVARAGMRNPPPRNPAWLAAALVAAAPDGDIVLGILLGRGGTLHGTFTHSLSAVAVVALLAYALGGGRWAGIAGAAYGSHLLVDLLDESGPTNLMLGWPFSGARPYSLGKFFPKVPVDGRGVMETVRNVMQPGPLTNLVVQTLLGAAIFGALLLVARLLQRGRAAGAPAD
jgi:membrane-bound metal-dependent hydrolase YbcI (DUF457 family)